MALELPLYPLDTDVVSKDRGKALPMFRLVFVFAISIGFSTAHANPALISETTSSAHQALGDHHPLFIVKKNLNRENVMVVYTKLDKNCRVVVDPTRGNQPMLGFYWLMGGKKYKKVSRLVENGMGPCAGIRDRISVVGGERGKLVNAFAVSATDLDRLSHDLKDNRLTIKAERGASGKCEAGAYMQLGAKHANALLQVQVFDAQAEQSGLCDANVYEVRVEGTGVASKQAIKAVYKGKASSQSVAGSSGGSGTSPFTGQ